MTKQVKPAVLLTRSADDNAQVASVFHASGLKTVSLPGIAIAEPEDWSAVDAALRTLGSYDGVFFTSRIAVRSFLARLDSIGPDGRETLHHLLIAAVGQKTEEALAAAGIRVDIVPEVGAAENLLASLDTVELGGKRFLFPKSSIARDILPSELRDRGADVDEIVVYRTIPPEAAALDTIRRQLLDRSISCVTFFSPSAVRNIVQMLGSQCLKDATIAVIGPTTAEAARSMGMEPLIISPSPDTGTFARAIAETFRTPTDHSSNHHEHSNDTHTQE